MSAMTTDDANAAAVKAMEIACHQIAHGERVTDELAAYAICSWDAFFGLVERFKNSTPAQVNGAQGEKV